MTQRVHCRIGDIRCSQDAISPNFGDGRPVGQLVDDLKKRKTRPNDLDIRVYQSRSGNYWCLDHRRLLAVRQTYSKNYVVSVIRDNDFDEFNRKKTGDGSWSNFNKNNNNNRRGRQRGQ